MKRQTTHLVILLCGIVCANGNAFTNIIAVALNLDFDGNATYVLLADFQEFILTAKTNVSNSLPYVSSPRSGVFFQSGKTSCFWSLRPPNRLRLIRVAEPQLNSSHLDILELYATIPLKTRQSTIDASSIALPEAPFRVLNHWNSTRERPFEDPAFISSLLQEGRVKTLSKADAVQFSLPQHIQGIHRGEGFVLDAKTNVFYWNVLSDHSAVIRDAGGVVGIVRRE